MASQYESFDLSGPVGLTRVDWNNPRHRMAVMACLVQAVYTLEDDRQVQREGPQALAPPWSESFHFQLRRMLLDSVDSSIIGAIFEYKPPSSSSRNRSVDGPIFKYKPPSSSSGNRSADGPRFVVAFRGTMVNIQTFAQDIELGLELVRHGLQSNPRFKTAMQAVRDLVATAGASSVWLAGHPVGSAIALQAGKNMAKSGLLLESFLFNPPYPSAPIETIESEQGKKWLRVATSAITAALMLTEMDPREWTSICRFFRGFVPLGSPTVCQQGRSLLLGIHWLFRAPEHDGRDGSSSRIYPEDGYSAFFGIAGQEGDGGAGRAFAPHPVSKSNNKLRSAAEFHGGAWYSPMVATRPVRALRSLQVLSSIGGIVRPFHVAFAFVSSDGVIELPRDTA